MPTKQSHTKGTAHSTPTKAKNATSDQVTPVKEAKGKGFFKHEATAMVREVLTNEPSDAKAAARLGVNLSTAYRLRKRLEKGLPLITPQERTPPPSPVFHFFGLQNLVFFLRRPEIGEGCQLADHAPL
jgi:hypothetical protein